MKLSAAINRFLDEQIGILAPASITWYRNRFEWLRPLHDRSLSKITSDDLRHEWQKLVKRKLSPYSLSGAVVAWRRLFSWCVKRKYLRTSPASDLRKPPLPDEPPKAISRSDMLKMLETSQSNGPRDYAILCMMIDTGARVGGVAGLRLCDLDISNERATVHEKGLGGNRRSRTIHLKPRAIHALRAWLDARDIDGKLVFGIKSNGIYKMLQRTAEQAGVKERYNPHAFRHGFARGALDNGADLATLAQLMGHRDVATTVKFYARWADDELHQKHRRFSWLPDETKKPRC